MIVRVQSSQGFRGGSAATEEKTESWERFLGLMTFFSRKFSSAIEFEARDASPLFGASCLTWVYEMSSAAGGLPHFCFRRGTVVAAGAFYEGWPLGSAALDESRRWGEAASHQSGCAVIRPTAVRR